MNVKKGLLTLLCAKPKAESEKHKANETPEIYFLNKIKQEQVIIVLFILAILLQLLITIHAATAQEQPQTIRGKVLNLAGEPLPGASVKIKETTLSTLTNENGEFKLGNVPGAVLRVTYIGYQPKEVPVTNSVSGLVIVLEPGAQQLGEVTVSTGYQDIPQERATGSFSKVDNALLNRRVSTDVLSRLEDEVPGLIFNRNNSSTISSSTASQSAISIRGQSTILGKSDPLIVVDNFPYEGDISNINPNDVESITILKDAAAASIWGARAGNGVIVITTKKGAFGSPVQVAFNSNVTVGERPDLFYQPQMSSADFIDLEKKLFDQGYYTSAELSSSHAALSPVVELLIAKRDGLMPPAQADAQIDALKQYDLRNDLEKYFYRKSVNQQYSLNLKGGAANQRYYLSAGYDQDLSAQVKSDYSRFTLDASDTYALLKQKLEVTAGLNLVQSRTHPGSPLYNPAYNTTTSTPNYPYARLVNEEGKPLPVVKDFRTGFVQEAQKNGLLNWQYRPLEELQLTDNRVKLTDYRLNTQLRYKILPGLSAQLLYQYNGTLSDGRNLHTEDSYFTRNLVNSFTQVDPSTGALSYPVPVDGILDLSHTSVISQHFRAQLNLAHRWSGKHELHAIAGYEISDRQSFSNTGREYGYDPDNATLKAVSYLADFPQYYSSWGGTAVIPYMDDESALADRYRSYYANAAYTYSQRYTVSASARTDQSNIFGVRANQKGVPLYSAGLAWNINRESFYHLAWLPYLKLRLSYGYNGNVYKSVSAYTTASSGTFYSSSPNTGLTYATITNPPNPELHWERVKIVNVGLDFALLNNRIAGSLEYYRKKGIDLIGNSPFDPTTGISTFTGNNAATKGQGTDLNLTTKNTTGRLKWSSSLLFSRATDQVTSYKIKQEGYNYPVTPGAPLEGKPLYAIYSYRWAGLDPQTGDPQGYLDGERSKDYSAIILGATPGNLVYSGPARPAIFGAFRNTLNWKNISLSANISYRLGYYFRKNSINYTYALQGQGGHGDYALRWQKPGDEALTSVPSMPETMDTYRDAFYISSEALTDKADHIRFQDVNLSYDLTQQQLKRLPFSRLRLYVYVNNLGLIWKANKRGIDPDYPMGPPPKTYALGLNVNF